MKTPILALAGNATTGPSNSAIRYTTFCAGASASSWTTTLASIQMPMPVAGSLTGWKIIIPSAPGSGKSYLFELMLNGSADASFKITIADAATTGSVSGPLALVAGDITAIRCTPSGTPTAITVVQMSFIFEGTTSTDSVIFGGTGTQVGMTNTSTYYYAPGALYSSTTAQTRAMGVVASPGTIDRLYVYAGANVATGTWTCELYKSTNGGVSFSPTGVTISLTGGGRLASDTTHTFTVARGDTFQLVATPTSTPTSVDLRWSCRFTPDTAGESLLFSLLTDTPDDSSNRYFNANGATGNSVGATESNVYNLISLSGASAKNLVTVFGTAPASGKSRSTTLRVNGSSTALTNTISDTGLTASDTTHSVSLNDNDLIDFVSTPSGNFPTAPGAMQIGMVLYIAPASSEPTVHLIYRKI